MPMRKRRPWSPQELLVMGRFVRAVPDGRYDAIANASRAYLLELARVRVKEGRPDSVHAKTPSRRPSGPDS